MTARWRETEPVRFRTTRLNKCQTQLRFEAWKVQVRKESRQQATKFHGKTLMRNQITFTQCTRRLSSHPYSINRPYNNNSQRLNYKNTLRLWISLLLSYKNTLRIWMSPVQKTRRLWMSLVRSTRLHSVRPRTLTIWAWQTSEGTPKVPLAVSNETVGKLSWKYSVCSIIQA